MFAMYTAPLGSNGTIELLANYSWISKVYHTRSRTSTIPHLAMIASTCVQHGLVLTKHGSLLATSTTLWTRLVYANLRPMAKIKVSDELASLPSRAWQVSKSAISSARTRLEPHDKEKPPAGGFFLH
ncbi:MAG: hypothetical protein CM15mP120_19610 [Pseudomonadota bacterium]|nr:MAG: hypothetical protein CM15mP120_19610 [Pseudomonadota bacterium]